MRIVVFILFILVSTFKVNSQNCQGVFLIDSLDNPSIWNATGIQVVPGFGNPPGALDIHPIHKRLQFWAFKNKQTYRLQRPLGCRLDANDTWTAEFQFVINSTAFNETAGLFILTEDTNHWQSDTPAGYTNVFNQNDAIAFFIEDSLHLSGGLQRMQGFIYGKKDSVMSSQQTVAIDLSRGVDYYTRIQRINPSTIKLSIFDDSLRTSHANNSPVFVQIDSTIGNLNYLQFATKTASPQLRSSFVFSYNYRIQRGLSVGLPNAVSTLVGSYKIGPNPATNELFITQKISKTLSIRVLNPLGKEVFRRDNWKENKYKIDVEQYTPGLYFVEIIDGKERNLEKIIVD